MVFSIVIWRKATTAWKDAESIIRARAQMQANAPSGKAGQSTQNYEMPLIVRPASADKELLADYEFIQESMASGGQWQMLIEKPSGNGTCISMTLASPP